jgi:hypothetical protein
MKKKETLVKRLFIYVFSLCMLSLYTTSCVSYDEDIDDIYKRLEELQTQIDAIKKQIEEGNYVVSVEKLSNGIRIKFIRGESYDIINGTNGKDGADAEEWHISPVDSMWYKGGVKQPFRAVGEAGKQGETAPSPEMFKKNEGEYYWIIFKWDGDTNDFIPDTLDDRQGYEPLYSYNTYVVDKSDHYELHVWVEDPDTPDNSKYDIIRLPKEGVENPFLEFLGYDRIRYPETPISLTRITNDIEFFYWYVSRLRNATDGGDTTLWVGRKTVKPHQVLTTLDRDSAAAIIRTNLRKTSWKLTLKDSKGGLLPISFGNPVRHRGSLTRASADSIYILQMNGVQDTFPNVSDYSTRFQSANGLGVVYSLIDTVTGINSGYKASITPREGLYSLTTANLLTIDGHNGGTETNKEYQVKQNRDIKIAFTNAAYLYDHYVEAADTAQARTKFGFTVNKPNGTFKIAKAEEATFKIIIYKLHYNGDFYKDTVTIKPIVP